MISRWLALGNSGATILYSPVSAAELWAGARLNEYEGLNNLFSALTCVPIDAEIGRQAGMYMGRYRKSHGLQIGDALIASGAVSSKAVLWTRNRKHYPMKDVAFFD